MAGAGGVIGAADARGVYRVYLDMCEEIARLEGEARRAGRATREVVEIHTTLGRMREARRDIAAVLNEFLAAHGRAERLA